MLDPRPSRSGAAAGRAHSDDGCDHLSYARARPHTIGSSLFGAGPLAHNPDAIDRWAGTQIWIHHTGYDTSHIYGSSVKEWQMDVVVLIEDGPKQPDTDVSIKLKFTKARRRRQENREDFTPGTITLSDDQWSWEPDTSGISSRKGAKRGRPIAPGPHWQPTAPLAVPALNAIKVTAAKAMLASGSMKGFPGRPAWGCA